MRACGARHMSDAARETPAAAPQRAATCSAASQWLGSRGHRQHLPPDTSTDRHSRPSPHSAAQAQANSSGAFHHPWMRDDCEDIAVLSDCAPLPMIRGVQMFCGRWRPICNAPAPYKPAESPLVCGDPMPSIDSATPWAIWRVALQRRLGAFRAKGAQAQGVGGSQE